MVEKKEVKKVKETSDAIGQQPIEVPKGFSVGNASETFEKPKDTIEVSKGLLESMQKEIEMLKQVADKKSLAQYYSRNQKELPKVVKLRLMEGKLIVGWRTIQDEVYEDSGTHRWVEKQVVELMYQDGKTEQMPLRDFVRKYTTIESTVLSTITTQEGNEAVKVQRKDNNDILEIGTKYIN